MKLNFGTDTWVRLVSLTFVLTASGEEQNALAAILFLLGIPHGAADHLLHSVTRSGRNSGPVAFARFYLLAMLAFTALWGLAPAVAFSVFIGLSVYHFGQTKPGTLADQLIWGTFYLGFPVTFHYAEAGPIIEGMLSHPFPVPGSWMEVLPWVLALVAGVNAAWRRRVDLLADLLVLCLLYVSTSLLLGFAVFFLFWHSLPSALEQYAFLRARLRAPQWREFVRYLLPMSLGAAAFLWAAYSWLFAPGDSALPLSRVFILVSIITLPHAMLVDRVYRPE